MTTTFSSRMIAKTLMAGTAAVAISSTAALAQTDQIIVTATKRPQTLQEVPVAVSVIGAETIEDAQILDLIDLQASVPSLRVTQLQNSSQTNFVIRGFGNGANNPGIESAVGVFVDGVFRSRSASSILDLPTLERVEVLRGPQSTLFGKNVSVGAISITTKSPEFDLGGSVEATYGNLNQVQFRGTLTGPISETLAFRVSGSINQRDGQYTNLVTGEDNINERDRWAARAQLLWEPNDVMSWRLIGEYNRIEEVCCGAVQLLNSPATLGIGAPPPFGLGLTITPVQDLDAREVALNTEPLNELVGRGGSLHGDWDLGWAQLTSITSWRQQIDNNQTDVDFSGADLATNPLRLDTRTFTQEVRLAGENELGNTNLNWLVGGFLFDDNVDFERDVIFQSDFRDFANLLLAAAGTDLLTVEGGTQVAAALTTPGAAPFTVFPQLGPLPPIGFGQAFTPGTSGVFGDYRLDNRSYSLFGQVDWELTDRLTITGGISYIDDRKIATGVSNLVDPASNFDFIAGGQSFVAATALGGMIPAMFGGPVAFDPANPIPFIGAAGAFAAGDPANFMLAQAGALAFAQNPANAALNPFAPLAGPTGLQFFVPQVNFPQPGAVRDDEISLSDDGFTNDTDFNYTARIAYDVADWLNVYFNYGTGFKASAVSLTSDSFVPTVAADGSIIGRFAEPESVRSFEIGIKTAFDGGYINIALFDQDVSNFQSNIFTGTGFIISNAEEQNVRGFEVDSAYSPIEPLNLTFGITYLDPEFSSFTNAPCATIGLFAPECQVPGVTTFDASGLRPAGIHTVSLSTSATWTHDFTNGAIGSARIEYLYESDVQVVDGIPANIASREVNLINANISYELENGFGINVWGRNLTDDDYLLSAFPTTAQAGSFSGYVNPQRTYGVSVRKKF